MKIAIMQPTYIPWIGYFDLIKKVDAFVFLDDVQFEKQSWQQRNRILLNNNYHFLTIPVYADSLSKLINETRIDNKKNWQKAHIGTINQAYAKHSYCRSIFELMDEVFIPETKKLIDITIPFIKTVAHKIGFNTDFYLSSEFGTEGKRSEKLVNILNHFNCNDYLSPNGSKDYIEEDGLFLKNKINVEYQNYVLKTYPQHKRTDFMPYLSILDLIANVGFNDAKNYI